MDTAVVLINVLAGYEPSGVDPRPLADDVVFSTTPAADGYPTALEVWGAAEPRAGGEGFRVLASVALVREPGRYVVVCPPAILGALEAQAMARLRRLPPAFVRVLRPASAGVRRAAEGVVAEDDARKRRAFEQRERRKAEEQLARARSLAGNEHTARKIAVLLAGGGG